MFKLIRVERRGPAWYTALAALVVLALSGFVAAGKAGAADPGTDWTARTSAADNIWESVSYGNGLFVAVSSNGTDRVMTSPDAITWTGRSAAVNNNWQSVTFGEGLFVAVAGSGTGNRVMTSPDGITWTTRTSAADNQWESVTYGGGQFVAVARSGTGNRVMTSPDGITWTSRSSAADNDWYAVTYGNGVFVATAASGTGNRVMTSPDGITWTSRTSAADNTWNSVTYGNGLFVAVSSTGTGFCVIPGAAMGSRLRPGRRSLRNRSAASGIPAQYPRLAGQYAEYMESQLTAFRSGARANNASMTAVSARLSDREIKAVADYIAGLR